MGNCNYANFGYVLCLNENIDQIKPLIANQELRAMDNDALVERLENSSGVNDINDLDLEINGQLINVDILRHYSEDDWGCSIYLKWGKLYLVFGENQLFFPPEPQPILNELKDIGLKPELDSWVTYG